MSERNPYENDETVDIPDFPSIKDSDDDIDRSIFQMSDDTASQSEVDSDDDEEYYEEEPTYLKVKKSGVVVAGIVMAALLVLAIFGVVWGVSRNSKLSALQTEYDQYKATATATETSLNAKITELENQIASSSSSTNTTTEGGTTYKVGSEIDTSIAVRSGAGTSNSKVKRSDLSSAVQSNVNEDSDGYAYVTGNDTFTVYETKDDSDGNTWGRIDSNAWVCVKYGGATWAYAD